MRFVPALLVVAFFLSELAHSRPSGTQQLLAKTPTLVGTMAGGNAYGRATIANDGSLLGSATYFEGNNNTIKALSSTNSGGTWRVLGSIATGPSNAHDIDNTYLLQLPSGRILAAFRNHDMQGKGNYTYYRITVSSSDDGGKSWEFLSQAAENPANPNPNSESYNGVWEPFLRLTSLGVLQIYYSRENNATDQDIVMSSSTNGGLSWSLPVVAIGADKSDSRDGMITVVSNGASSHLAVFESGENGGAIFQVQQSVSSDDGSTWGPRGLVYAAPNKLSAGAPQVANVDETLVTAFMTNEDTGVAGASDEAVKMVTSGDNGNTWGNKLVVAQAPAFWPGVCKTGNDTFIVIYGTDVVRAQNVTLS